MLLLVARFGRPLTRCPRRAVRPCIQTSVQILRCQACKRWAGVRSRRHVAAGASNPPKARKRIT